MQNRCEGTALVADGISIQCSLHRDHFELHMIRHDDVVLISWGLDDEGNGHVASGVLGILSSEDVR